MQIGFRHGLGDCVQFAHLLQLYRRRGHHVSVHYEENKTLVWQAADVPYAAFDGARHHDWRHPPGFNQPNPDEDWSGNKAHGNLNLAPLPPIADVRQGWEELCAVDLQGSVEAHLSDADRQSARRFLANLPRPIVLLHTSGTNLPGAKNIPTDVVSELYRRMLAAFDGSLVLLDWDDRVPTLAHGRVRHIKRDWGHLNLNQLAALMGEAALLIGVDSGPFHFAALTHLPALGIFHNHYPSCVALPREVNVCMTRPVEGVNAARRPDWNIVEYEKDLPTAAEIAAQALRMLEGPRYGLKLGRDVMMQQWVRDWCLGASDLAPLADRNRTFDALLRAAAGFADPRIVETGCIRAPEDWAGAGNSTYVFGAWLDGRKAGRLVSVDNDADNCAFARDATRPWSERILVECADSVTWLRATDQPIDILYLDSMDVDAPGYAAHGLAEIMAAEARLSEGAMVVYDDTPWNGGWVGKGALGVPYLLDKGWKVLATGYQTLLSRVEHPVAARACPGATRDKP